MARGKQLAVFVLFAVVSLSPAAGSNGRIVTKVVTSSGALAPKVALELFDAEGLAKRPLFGIPSDEEFVPATGLLRWSAPPGRYVIGVNITRPATKESPYPPMFYPGVRDVAAAQVFELGSGQQLDLPPFTLPAAPLMLTIRGSIVRTDARAVGGISVFLDSAETYSVDAQIDSVQAERDGRFAFTVPAGSRYRLKTTPWKGMRAVSEPFELTQATAPVLLVMRPPK